jgi:DNA-binding transcriptional regulator PaaX
VPLTRSIRATAWKEHLDEGRLTERLLAGLPLTAASFIVTVYGDAVLPRGEVLSMSSLIEICADVGISENLVRTATSRLVASGRLEGERSGRHSFYRLAPAAHTEFADAAHLLYTSQTEAAEWSVLYAPGIGRKKPVATAWREWQETSGFARSGADCCRMPLSCSA